LGLLRPDVAMDSALQQSGVMRVNSSTTLLVAVSAA